MTLSKWQKIVLIPILIIVLLGPVFAPFAESFNFPERYDLVAILVEQGLYSDAADYDGLVGSADGPISRTTIKSRVDRYAADLQNELPGTRTLVIQVDRYETTENIAAVLERLYFEGDPKEPGRVAYLKGVVIIGDVPLPVVNKKGTRFISLFPYTDFEQKAYVWNQKTRDFEFSTENPNPQPEIWHGVIRPPVSTQIEDGKKLTAAYFDKNHLYHIGDARYTTFDKKVFFQDFIHEKKNLSKIAYKNYLNFLEHQSDVAYLRYTKAFFNDLAGPVEEEVAQDQAAAASETAALEDAGIPSDSSGFAPPGDVQDAIDEAQENGSGEDPKRQVPDIMTKIAKMTDGLMFRFNQLFTKYPAMVNDLMKYTGRYTNIDTAVNLITAKDQYTMSYLKAVNTMVENKIDGIVENNLQQRIPLITEASITVTQATHKPLEAGDDPFIVTESSEGVSMTPAAFTNFSPESALSPPLRQKSIRGTPFTNVASPSQCSLYRGSKGTGRYSKLVSATHALNQQSAVEGDGSNKDQSPAEMDLCDALSAVVPGMSDKNCVGFYFHAGCYYVPPSADYDLNNQNKNWCFAENAVRPILDLAGTQEIQNAPIDFDNYKQCFDFHEKETWQTHIDAVQSYLGNVDDYDYDFEDRLDVSRPPALTQLTKNPDDIPLITSTAVGDTYTLALGTVLRNLRFNLSGSGWQKTLNEFFADDSASAVHTVPLVNPTHSKLSQATIRVDRTVDHTISSVFYHKEPTNQTLSAQARNLSSPDLPVDNPRYLTFQDKDHETRRITYPDIFTQPSLDAYVGRLRDLENELNAAPRPVGFGAPCLNCLTSLVSNLADTLLTRANRTKVLDAIDWKNMDIDSKHFYINEYYMDPAKNAYVGESVDGYELAYINGEGDARNFEFAMNPGPAEEEDAAFGEGKAEASRLAEQKENAYEDDPKNPFDEPPEDMHGQAGYDLFSWSPPPVSPWWERMQEWTDSLTEDFEPFTFGKSESEFYGSLDEENQRQLEQIQKESSDIEASLATGGDVDLSHVASLELLSDSPIVAAGKNIEIKLVLKDKNGKPVLDEFSKVNLGLEGDAHFGTGISDQITVTSASFTIGVTAPASPGNFKITAQIPDSNKKTELNLSAADDAHIAISSSVLALTANGSSEALLDISAVSKNGDVISGAHGKVRLALGDPLLGRLAQNEVTLNGGRGQVRFISGKKKGTVFVNATSSVFDPGQTSLSLLPGPPTRIALKSDFDTLPVIPGSHVGITASLFDENGNSVDSASGMEVNFRLTENTSAFGSLSSLSEAVQHGQASVTLSPREETGTMNVIAESSGLRPGVITIKSAKRFGENSISAMQPDALAGALLGIPAGDVVLPGYLGGWFVMKGRTQVAVSLTTPPISYKKLFEVNEKGAIRVSEKSRITASFLPANNFTLVLHDNELAADLAEVSLFTIRDGAFDVTESDSPELLADGIYMRNLSSDKYRVDRLKGALRLSKGDSEKMEIQTNGYLRIFDNDVTLSARGSDFLVLQVLDKGLPAAEIYFVQRFNQDVRISDAISDAPGVYVKPLSVPPHITHGAAFTGHSSADPRGAAFYDTTQELSGAEAPGFAFQSLEDSQNRFGVGFTEDNKFGLLFAAGERFGEANRPYASDIGIVLGDPLVRVTQTPDSGNFTQDVGKLIYPGGSEVRGILNLDYNGDGFEDILIVQGSGRIRLLQNNGGADKLKDQGFILDIKNGIQDFTKIDFNNDGQMDLVIAGTESCRKGDTCIDVYENRGGEFVRRNLHFNQIDKIVTVRERDLNNDSFHDLVIADAGGDIRVIYNKNGRFEEIARPIGNVGLQINPSQNLVSSVLLRYPGMTSKNPNDPASAQSYLALSIPSLQDFIYADLDDGVFENSSKFGEDLNGGVARGGDRIRYTITLRNGSAAAKNDVSVSDVAPEQIEIDEASIHCTDCLPAGQAGGTQTMEIQKLNGEPTRQYLFKNMHVPGNSARHIVYEGVFKGDTESAAKITIGFNSRFSDTNAGLNSSLAADEFPDLSVSKDDNPTGRVRYFYTTGISDGGILAWGSGISSPPVPVSAADFLGATGLKIPSAEDANDYETVCNDISGPLNGLLNDDQRHFFDTHEEECEKSQARGGAGGHFMPSAPPPIASDALNNLKTADADGDGLPDSIDEVSGALDSIAAGTQAAISKATCDAGCIALPLNAAFLAPGPWSVLGTPTGFDIGLPVFGWGAPSLIPVWPPTPALSTLGGRLYVSPTLTGGLGFGICLGPYGTPKNCYSFGINPMDIIAPGTCDSINGATSAALAGANDVIADANEGVTLTIPSPNGATGGGSRRSSGSGLGNYSLGSYESPVARSRNIRIPGFPSVLTDWFSAQVEEFTDKALSLPDIYLIYPSGDSILGGFKATEEFSRTGNLLTNVISYLNSVPLLDIETQDVLFKVPIITRKEVELFKADARQWIKDERAELDKWKNLMGCFGLTGNLSRALNPELCRFVDVNMEQLISTVAANMKALDDWILFPKKVLQFRAIESYYVNQIIDYLDTVIQFTGGWVKKNIARVKQWRRAVRQMKDVLENWKAMVKVMIDYNESCDKCKTERYSLKDLILKLFIAVPTPPVIPLPKLPDIIIDFSKVQAGARVQLPNITFKPEPLTLPRIPRIGLGVNLTIPLFRLQIPPIPVIPGPPALPQLRALPPLRLGKLPDLPPPPTLPGLPGQLTGVISILKKIVKILCLIRLGLIPTDELLLKPRIEEITARPLSPVLPIDLLFTIQAPTITVTYIDQLIVTLFTNFQLDFNSILDTVRSAAREANAFTTNFVKKTNSETNGAFEQLQRFTNPQLDIGPNGLNLNYKEELKKKLTKLTGEDAGEAVDLGYKLGDSFKGLLKTQQEYRAIAAAVPKNITVEMGSEKFVPGSVAVNQSADFGLSLPFIARLQNYRDSLAAYVSETDRLRASENVASDISDFSRYIANVKSPFAGNNFKQYLAANDFTIEAGSVSKEPVRVGPFDVDSFLISDSIGGTAPRLLALGPNLPPPIPLPGLTPGSGGPSGTGEIKNLGIFYIDNDGSSRRLVNYTLEANQPSRLADIDIDNDGDKDKVYSYGANVFLKENFRHEPDDLPDPFRPVDVEFWTIFELMPKGMSQNFPKVLSETAHDASFTFQSSGMKNLAGFEVIARNSPFFFENPEQHASWKVHLLPDPAAAQNLLDEKITLENPDGEVLINDSAPQSLSVKLGDDVKTKDGGSVMLGASDGTLIHVSENSHFRLQQGGAFNLEEGSTEIEIPKTGSLLFPPGAVISALEGNVRVRFFDGSDVRVEAGSPFTLPDFRPLLGSVASISGSASFTGQKRELIEPRSGKIHIAPGDILHPLEVVEINWNIGQPGARLLTLSREVIMPVPENFAQGLDIEMEDGVLEVIRAEAATQPLILGQALMFGDKINVTTGSARLHYSSGGDTTVRSNETYMLQKLEDREKPTSSLSIPPAFYFAKIYAFDADGNRSTGSEKLLLAPQICGDTVPPIANLGKAAFTVAIGKTLAIDALRSFDSFSNVISYSLAEGEQIIPHDETSPHFTLGPYSEVGQKHMRLTVLDEALNEGYQDITVNVITPRIVLDAAPLKSNIISGFVEPPEAAVPITIARLKSGPGSLGWEVFKTPTADASGQYYTDPQGKFEIKDADLRDSLVIRNREGVIVAQVNTKTGRITVTDGRYETRLMPASPGYPTRIGVYLKTDPSLDQPLSYVYFVPDVNTDTTIDMQDFAYNASSVLTFAGVHIKPLSAAAEKGISFAVLPGDDPQIPGATAVSKSGTRISVIDVNGDILKIDPLISVREKTIAEGDSENSPVIFEMLYEGTPIAEIFIAANLTDGEHVQIVEAPAPPPRPKPIARAKDRPFTDVTPGDPFATTIQKLYDRGIVAGYPTSVRGELLFKPENKINRAEFTQITLKMLCIVPREEARKLPTPFFDVLDPKLWFYPVLKEGNIRGFIRGYVGEARTDPETGSTQTPFKPANPITRAEAATVVLAALAEEDVIDISKVDFSPSLGAPWYEKYVQIAQNLTPYLKRPGEARSRAFLITSAEALSPNTEISRKDFATMADRVLLIYDCNDPDKNKDGIPDNLGLAPNEDPDVDQCTNLQEFQAKTDPLNPDTDSGGVPDCEEIRRGTDPVRNPYDDRPQVPRELLDNVEGIFVLRPLCGEICPCRATIGSGADLNSGDTIFAAITGSGGLPIYAKSNEEKY